MMLIPTLSPSSIKDIELEDLMRTGFCYVKLQDETLRSNIQTCMGVARNFLLGTTEEKEKWRLKDTLEPGEQYQGYVVRSQPNTNIVEQFFFEPDAPFGPYEPYAAIIKNIRESFTNQIFLPLVQAIFNKMNFDNVNFIEATTNPTCSLVFNLYPAMGKTTDTLRLNPHKDFGLLTILFFEEPGLEVKYQNDWHSIPAKEGCVIVNIGNAIELMTGKKCHSALHRVTNTTNNRVAMVYFINPNYQQKVRNYSDNTLIAETGEIFFKEQFVDYYEVDH